MNSNDRAPEPVTTRVSVEGADMQMLAGVNDSNLVELGRAMGTRVALRGDLEKLALTDTAMAVAQALVSQNGAKAATLSLRAASRVSGGALSGAQ